MAIVGMDPNSVLPAAKSLEDAAVEMNHAASGVSMALFDPPGLPPDFARRARALADRTNGCITSADAMAVHSVDLKTRAQTFERLEADTNLTPGERGTLVDDPRPLWNHASRKAARLNPGEYFSEIDSVAHPTGGTAGTSGRPGEATEAPSGELDLPGGKTVPLTPDVAVPTETAKVTEQTKFRTSAVGRAKTLPSSEVDTHEFDGMNNPNVGRAAARALGGAEGEPTTFTNVGARVGTATVTEGEATSGGHDRPSTVASRSRSGAAAGTGAHHAPSTTSH